MDPAGFQRGGVGPRDGAVAQRTYLFYLILAGVFERILLCGSSSDAQGNPVGPAQLGSTTRRRMWCPQ